MLDDHLSVGVGNPGEQIANRSICLLVYLGLLLGDWLWYT
jgi:hypothetical protein